MAATRAVRVDTRIEGLKELIAELRKSPERLDLQMRKEFRDVAREVRDKARAAAQARRPGGTGSGTASRQHWSDLVNTIRSGSTDKSPTVSIGDERVPWVVGHEFGSLRSRQFPAWSGNGASAGYFFWPAVRANREELVKRSLAAIDAALKQAYPD